MKNLLKPSVSSIGLATAALALILAGCGGDDGTGKIGNSNNTDNNGTITNNGAGSTCGDGVVDAGETCDDSNTADGDGCSADCSSDETCGNGVVDAAIGEACDDGNTADDDGCTSACAYPSCGDGVVTGAEACDDGNNTDGDGCNARCTSDESCGNSILDAASGEFCDDGNTTDGDGCQAGCVLPTCGDGIVDSGEVCDDGNNADGDGCAAACDSDESCGNGILDAGETCDDRNNVDGDGCQAACTLPACGDGVLDPGETCDDGNTADADGCSATCQSDESCGNGILDTAAGEVCDDGNTNDGDGCQAGCALPSCGDGILDPAEVCDDGNNQGGDGCSAACSSLENCGNGILDTAAGESCDDGNNADGDGCQAACVLPVCGDGVLDTNEVCDDGNNGNGDGCSANCDSDETCGNGFTDLAAGEECDDGNVADGDGCDSTCEYEATTGTPSCTFTAAPVVIPAASYGYGDINFDANCNVIVYQNTSKQIALVHPTTGAITTLATLPAAAGNVIAVVYLPSNDTYYTADSAENLYSITSAGVVTSMGTTTQEIEAMAIAPPTFGAFGGSIIAATQGGGIVEVNPTTGAFTVIGANTATLSDLAFAADGTLYVAHSSQIDTMTPAGVFTTLTNVAGGTDGVTVDEANNRLWVATSGSDTLYSVDRTSAVATAGPSYDFDSGFFVTGLLMNADGSVLMATGEGTKTLTVYTP